MSNLRESQPMRAPPSRSTRVLPLDAGLPFGFGFSPGSGQDHVLDDVGPQDERERFEPGVNVELAQDVLDVRPGGLRADYQTLGDDVIVGPLDQQRQDFALSASEP